MKSWPSGDHAQQRVDLSLRGPRVDAVHTCNRASDSNEASDTLTWMYELQLARELPAVDISRTPLRGVLSPAKYTKTVKFMHKLVPILVRLNRVNILVFGSILFLPAAVTRPWIPLLGVISLLPPLCFTAFLSLEILTLLRRNYEFWFVSVLNIVNWIGVGQLFGDFRAVVCVRFWLNSQSVISIDANYRTYQTTVKSIVMAGPSMLALVVCCSYRLIVDASSPSLSIASVALQWRQIVIFTASTLIIFMFKKAYAKIRRRRRRVHNRTNNNIGGDRHVISCVVLTARMRLVPALNKQRLRVANFVRNETATASCMQHLRLAYHGSLVVDTRRVFLGENILKWFLAPSARVIVHVIAITGLAATAATWILLLNRSEHVLVAAVVAFSFSIVFVLLAAALAQKELLRLLVWNFDVLFSVAQATALALCLMDLLQWEFSSTLAVITWWLWFLWILMLDALTPSVSHQLRLRKLALPIFCLVLFIAAVCAVSIVMGENKLFKTRLLFSLSFPKLGAYHEYTETLAVQRFVTIIGWNARILFELALSDPKQLIFIRRRIEYTSPFPTFSEPFPGEQELRGRHIKQWRAVTIVPQNAPDASQGSK